MTFHARRFNFKMLTATFYATVIPCRFFVFLIGYKLTGEGFVLCSSQVCNALHNNYARITYDLIKVTACFSGVRVFHHFGLRCAE